MVEETVSLFQSINMLKEFLKEIPINLETQNLNLKLSKFLDRLSDSEFNLKESLNRFDDAKIRMQAYSNDPDYIDEPISKDTDVFIRDIELLVLNLRIYIDIIAIETKSILEEISQVKVKQEIQEEISELPDIDVPIDDTPTEDDRVNHEDKLMNLFDEVLKDNTEELPKQIAYKEEAG